jgi:tetrahydromethanopterin S-methyltransferase subunit D
MELLLDRSNPLHWIAVAVLLVSGAAAAWIGVRDGFVRRRMATNTGLLTGRRAVAAGALYVATGLAGVVGAAAFVLRGR